MAELKPCPNPNCGYTRIWKVHIHSARLPWWWYCECQNCHWCGETKLFLWRAKRAWNRQYRRYGGKENV